MVQKPLPDLRRSLGLEVAHPDSTGCHSGLHVCDLDYSGLQTVPSNLPQKTLGTEGKEAYAYAGQKPEASLVNEGKRSKRRLLWPAIAILYMVITIAVIVPAVILTETKSMESGETAPDASPDAQSPFLSRKGAWNGTGIGKLDPNDQLNSMMLFFQHHTGEIRSALNTPTGWVGGTSKDVVVPSNVKNGTPIAAQGYLEGPNSTYHIVYIDSTNTLQDMKQINMSGKWIPGSLGSFHFMTSNAAKPALALCVSPTWPSGSTGRRRVYFGGEDNLIHELSLPYQSDVWSEIFKFPPTLNSNAGVYSRVPNGRQYLYAVTMKGALETWWYDHEIPTGTVSHALAEWVQDSAAAVTLQPNSSLGFTALGNVYFQDPKNNIIGIRPNHSCNKLVTTWGAPFQVGSASALPNTQITSRGNGNTSEPYKVFFQTNGTDITGYVRTRDTTEWASVDVPVE